MLTNAAKRILIGHSVFGIYLFCVGLCLIGYAETIELPTYIGDINLIRPPAPTGLRVVGYDGLSLPGLIGQLRDESSVARSTAAAALLAQAVNLKVYVSELSAEVTNRDPMVRRHITAILTKLGPDAYRASPAVVSGLNDDDAAVRANSAACLGAIGSAASFATTNLINLLQDKNEIVRRNAAGALGNFAQSASNAIPFLIALLTNTSPLVKCAAIHAIGSIGTSEQSYLPAIVACVHDTDGGVVAAALRAIEVTALRMQDDGKWKELPLLRQAQTNVLSINPTNTECGASLSRSIKYLELLPHETEDYLQVHTLRFLGGVPGEFAGETNVVLNGHSIEIRQQQTETNAIYYSGEENFIHDGLNWILSKGQQSVFWFEDRTLKKYKPPYSKSYAIIAAIDDYDRARDPKHRGPTGFRKLSFMVQNAKSLANALEHIGFPRTNILEFYNESATSDAITTILEEFWKGGRFSDAGRLFFYFGGHGGLIDDTPLIITYDHSPDRPTLSSFLMNDIPRRHFENIVTKHVFVALDCCCAGLAVPHFLDPPLDLATLKAFRKLSIIEAETAGPARNLLVATTGDQAALWENGGVFTQALTAGLSGDADYNQDHLIQFEELALFVKNQVTARARETGVIQNPDYWSDRRPGRGNVIFFKDNRN